ncbi:unknown protein [Microcystis aeruginosa NIES-843]|uniref:Uncharacterized protein n=1 Tax=Microcystis aeruginosa (strain NIES-843 / IAM M-2473) TaxID=449447 RepID=B0JLL4_MICAN|nr:unknown protein [Microcystis aeruginosa NIES-843]
MEVENKSRHCGSLSVLMVKAFLFSIGSASSRNLGSLQICCFYLCKDRFYVNLCW